MNLRTAIFKSARWAGDGRNFAEEIDGRTAKWANPDGSLAVRIELTPEQLAEIGAGVTVNVDGVYQISRTP